MKPIRYYIIPQFRCELGTTLSPERVWERLHEITGDGFYWPWNVPPPFWGIVEADRFKITHRKLDPSVDLKGTVEAKPGGSRILITASYGIAQFLLFIFCMFVLAWILWQAVTAGDNRFIALWAVGMPVIAALFHWLDIRTFWESVDESLECLKSELGATVISRACD